MNCMNNQHRYGQAHPVNYRRHHGHGHGFQQRRMGGPFGRPFVQGSFQVPVNIEETPDTFEIYVAAPGRTKQEFTIQVKEDVLTIAYQLPKLEGEMQTPNWRQREFSKGEFARSFFLNGKIDTTAINASYQEGILQVTLPKLPGADQPAQEVKIA